MYRNIQNAEQILNQIKNKTTTKNVFCIATNYFYLLPHNVAPTKVEQTLNKFTETQIRKTL